ncbi:hypothetical protein T492DRAFT_24994 [Pavlovales sp. CCMP2436]|nr:hypothetical protein T492DRAFT_24994 [Pavlovales sp. CCMP2436]
MAPTWTTVVAALVLSAAHGGRGGRKLLLMARERDSDAAACSQRHVYLDLGSNWANTLRLYEHLAPRNRRSRAWEPYVNDFCAWLNGEREREPLLCLPRSGSTPHLRSYAAVLGCRQLATGNDARDEGEDGWMLLDSPPQALIRGGSMSETSVSLTVRNEYEQTSAWYKKEDYLYRVRTTDGK